MNSAKAVPPLKLIEDRLLRIFEDYVNGKDVSPAMVFGTEGFIDVCCSSGLVVKEDVALLMANLHQQVFASPLLPMSGDMPGDKIRIPPLMKRAPVYPSTH